MSQTLTLNSFAPGGFLTQPQSLDDEEFFTLSQDETEAETVSFADQLMDMDFPMLDIKPRSSPMSLPNVQLPVCRKRPTWKIKNAMLTEEFLLKKSVKKRTTSTLSTLDRDDPYIDVTSDSSESDLSSFSQDSLDSVEGNPHTYTRFLRRSPVRSRPFFNPRDRQLSDWRDRRDSEWRERRDSRDRRESRDSDWRSHEADWRSRDADWRSRRQEVKKEGSFVNPREEMNMLRLSCTCQSRNTGKSLHLWEFLLEMLADRRMKSVIAWTGHAREFRVVNSREVAREWGNRKNKPHMNFDKMSRAMRYYYKKKILAHGNKQRLVYSFCQEPICPHYDKIIKLALKTRPQTPGGPCPVIEEPVKETSPRNWERPASPPVVKTSSASSKLKIESEKILTEKLCPGRNLKFSVKRPGRQDCPRPCCEGRGDRVFRAYSSRLEPSRSRPVQVRSSKNSLPNNQPKIKINSNKPNYNDCFKFS